MEEKKHVGRPTNEEVANRKKKKVIKYSLITIVSVLLVGGIALFLNRDKIDFSSLMGASIFKREKFYINSKGPSGEYKPSYDIYSTETNLVSFSRCKSSNSKIASCGLYDMSVVGYAYDQAYVRAHKKGNVTIKIYGKDKNGKEKILTRRFKVGNDITPPTCQISDIKNVKKNSDITITVKCNEKVTPTNFLINGTKKSVINGESVAALRYFVHTDFSPVPQYNVQPKNIKKVSGNSYKITFSIPKERKNVWHGVFIQLWDGTFIDSSGNENVSILKSNRFDVNI